MCEEKHETLRSSETRTHMRLSTLSSSLHLMLAIIMFLEEGETRRQLALSIAVLAFSCPWKAILPNQPVSFGPTEKAESSGLAEGCAART